MSKISRYFPTTSIRVYLMVMAVMTALPMLGFVFFLLTELERNEYENLKHETAQDAQMIGSAIERKLQDMSTTLRLLATSPELVTGDLAAFQARTAASLRQDSLYLVLIDGDGTQRLNTRVPSTTSLPKMSNMAALNSALASGHTEVSNIFFGGTSKQWVFNVTMPLPPTLSASGAAMVLTQNAGDLVSLIPTESLPPGWSAAVLDANGHVVVSNGPDNMPSSADFPAEMLALMTGANDSASIPGTHPPVMLGYAKLPGWSWQVAVWGPAAAAQASLATTWRQLIFGSLLLLTLGMLVAWAAAQQLGSSIKQIALMAERIGEGDIVAPVQTRIVEANQVAIALSNASFDRSQAEERVHFILHELVHRTKNILSLVQAMMRQIGRTSDNVEDFQAAVATRLVGLGSSMEALAQAQWDGIPITQLAELQLSTVTGISDRVDLRGRDFTLNANAVQNLGLAFHELATNSVKYGALSTPDGRVLIEWRPVKGDADDGEPAMQVRWSEIGGPPVKSPSRRGFGSTIIERHAASAFDGKVDLDFAATGLVWQLTAPMNRFELAKSAAGE